MVNLTYKLLFLLNFFCRQDFRHSKFFCRNTFGLKGNMTVHRVYFLLFF